MPCQPPPDHPIDQSEHEPVARRTKNVINRGLRAVVVEPSGDVVGPAIVAVHGISRNIREHSSAFAPVADRLGRRLVLPLFDLGYRGYQRLRSRRCEPRADELLWSLLDSIGEDEAVDLVGFSGGAQFVHRAAMVTPVRVRSLSAVAAGWYTFPDSEFDFPAGAKRRSTRGPALDLDGFGSVPVLVAVGERDVERDCSLKVDPEIDRRQGRNRRERALRWTTAISAASPGGVVEHRVLPGVGHSFRDAVGLGDLDLIVEQFLNRFAVTEPLDAEQLPSGRPTVASNTLTSATLASTRQGR